MSSEETDPAAQYWRLTDKQGLVLDCATFGMIALAALGVAAAVFVLWKYQIPSSVESQPIGRFGEPKSPESALQYLLVLPFFQCWVGFAGILLRRRARAGRSDPRQAAIQARFSWVRPAKETAAFYVFLAVAFAHFQLLLLCFAIFRAVVVVTRSV